MIRLTAKLDGVATLLDSWWLSNWSSAAESLLRVIYLPTICLVGQRKQVSSWHQLLEAIKCPWLVCSDLVFADVAEMYTISFKMWFLLTTNKNFFLNTEEYSDTSSNTTNNNNNKKQKMMFSVIYKRKLPTSRKSHTTQSLDSWRHLYDTQSVSWYIGLLSNCHIQ